MGDFPTMTDQGTFIINGAERVVVSQLVRSPGVYYTATEDPATGRQLYSAKVIPNRGAWLEFETAARHQLYVKVDRKRKLEATKLLRAVGYESNEEMVALFAHVDNGEIAVHRGDPGEGQHEHPPGSPHRGLQEAAPGRPAHRRQRREAGREPVLQLPPLRPRPRRPLQVQQEAGPGRRAHGHRAAARASGPSAKRRHRGHRRPPHRAQQRPRPAPTTSTTSATAASAPTASSSRTPSASACCAWSAWSRSG